MILIIYGVYVIIDGYNRIDSIGCHITTTLTNAFKLYENNKCSTLKSQESLGYLSGRMNKSDTTFDFIYWNDETRASIEHIHTVADINEIKDKLNNKSDIDHTHKITDTNGLQYELEGKADKAHTHIVSDITSIFDLIYPIGSIYTSMNLTSPATIFGGTWTQITDRFLYCANSSGTIGGSKKISVNQLSVHENYDFKLGKYYITGHNGLGSGRSDEWRSIKLENKTYFDTTPGVSNSIYTCSTSGGEDYMPSYITVYCWYRTA